MVRFAEQAVYETLLPLVPDEACPILIPEDAANSTRAQVTEQFLAGAGQYDQRYFNDGHWERLLRRAITDRADAPEWILDFGCGSGNSVIPLLRMFPNARIVAIDISPDLLAILRSRLLDLNESHRCSLACLDGTQTRFLPRHFDLIVGGSILHHLIRPRTVLTELKTALKRQGSMVFIEPFEIGAAIIRKIFLDIIEDERAAHDPLGSSTVSLFERIANDYATRAAMHKNDPRLPHLDDKWLFSSAFFQDIADSNNLQLSIRSAFQVRRDGPIINESVERRPTEKPLDTMASDELMTLARSRQFELYIRVLLRMHDDDATLPEWAWGVVEQYDALFSPDAKLDILHEGIVTLTRSD